jgi:hypothetical protein
MGGKWKNYEGDAAARKASEFSRRLITNTSADTTKAVEMLDSALAGENAAIGGDVAKQQYYATQIERLYNVKPTGGFEASVGAGGTDALNLRDAQKALTGGVLGKAQVAGKMLMGKSDTAAKRALDVQQEDVRQAFSDYVDSLLNAGDQGLMPKGTIPMGPGAAAMASPEFNAPLGKPQFTDPAYANLDAKQTGDNGAFFDAQAQQLAKDKAALVPKGQPRR